MVKAMKRVACALVACVMLSLVMTGCALHKQSSTAPAWAVTPTQRAAGDVIAAAVAAVDGYKADLAANKPGTDWPELKTTMQDIQKSLVIALPAYRTWSAALKADPSAQEPAALAGALVAIQGALTQLPTK